MRELRELRVSTFDMVLCLSRAVDLISPSLAHHHHQVAYIAHSLATELRLPPGQANNLLLAGALHDVGALSLQERVEAMAFEVDPIAVERHVLTGASMLSGFPPLSRVAPPVKYHHQWWNKPREDAPSDCDILHLADRVSVLVDRKAPVLSQAPAIVQRIRGEAGRMFSPGVVDIFDKLAERESFWLDLVLPSLDEILEDIAGLLGSLELGTDEVLDLSLLFSRLIDFRSPFTSTHSRGVATLAEELTRAFDFSAREALLMRAAGHLHDLGKLAVPSSILDKPGRLTDDEMAVVRTHTYHTYRILRGVEPLRPLAAWAALHHERLDGAGYPFHLHADDLPLRSRIMAVADVFTALTEDRPYRKALGKADVMGIMAKMAADRALDGRVVAVVEFRYEELDAKRARNQASAATEYGALLMPDRPIVPAPGGGRG